MKSDDGLAPVTYLPGVMPPVPGAPTAGTPVAGAPVQADTPAPVRPKKSRARETSIRALTRRDMSRWELEQVLRARDLDEDAVATELARLEELGLIDDGALADMLVRTRHQRKGLGRSALTAELRRRHVEQHHIDDALAQIDDDDEQATAAHLAQDRARRLTGLDHETAVRRLSGYLMRKGYSSEVVRAAVREALPGHRSGVAFD
ncbi:recombination regulator RecX [Parafrigoribacterium mesophilum]|uniref:regulatory protein RecX n=1 Tax=Parafrigoribacterium mesophilum TaxID=433646 RepID=UPI0031FDA946